jgi:membrane fusion protein, multidrug efflux system
MSTRRIQQDIPAVVSTATEGPESQVAAPQVSPPRPAARTPALPARPRSPGARRPLARRLWKPLLFALLIVGGGYLIYPHAAALVNKIGGGANAPGARRARIVPVVTAVARREDMPLYLNALGSVTGFGTVTVRSRVEGELMKVAFTEGQMVKQGDLLAEIDPRPFQVQLSQSEAQLRKDEAALKVATLDYQRYEQLVSSKTVTQQQLDAQSAAVEQAQGAVQADQGQIDNVKLQLTYCRITAPISGRIGLRSVDAGNIVRANDPTGLAVIAQLQPIAVVFTIPQDDIVRVQKPVNAGQTLAVEAFDRDFQTKLATGSLAAIDNQVDASTGTLRIKAVFENKDNQLFPNQFVNVRLLVETKHGVVIVPSSAVQRGPDSEFVYVVKSADSPSTESTVELRKVKVGFSEGDETVIDKGIAPGEVVVIDGIDKLQNGAEVSPRKAGAVGDAGDAPRSAEQEGAKDHPAADQGAKDQG